MSQASGSSAGVRPTARPAARLVVAAAGAAAAVLLIAGAAASGRPVTTTVLPPPESERLPGREGTPRIAEPGQPLELPFGLDLAVDAVLLLFLIAVVVAAVWLIDWRRLLARWSVARASVTEVVGLDVLPEKDEDEYDPVVREVRAGAAELDDQPEVADAVIRCWLRLERAAAAAGAAKHPADTSAELVARLLDRLELPAQRLDQMAALYRRARFSPEELGEADRATARRSLAEVEAALALQRMQRMQRMQSADQSRTGVP